MIQIITSTLTKMRAFCKKTNLGWEDCFNPRIGCTKTIQNLEKTYHQKWIVLGRDFMQRSMHCFRERSWWAQHVYFTMNVAQDAVFLLTQTLMPQLNFIVRSNQRLQTNRTPKNVRISTSLQLIKIQLAASLSPSLSWFVFY